MNKKGHFSNCLHSQKAARYAVFLLIITIAVRLSIFLIISQKNKKKYIFFTFTGQVGIRRRGLFQRF